MRLRYEAAFCHVRYRAENGEEMKIWNGRDGEVPNELRLPVSGQPAKLVQGPTYREPSYVPDEGEWIFIALHPERAVALAVQKVEAFWNDPKFPLAARYRTRDEAVEKIAAWAFGDGNRPDLVRCTPALRRRYFTGEALGPTTVEGWLS